MAWQDEVNHAITGGVGGDGGMSMWHALVCWLAAGWAWVQGGDTISVSTSNLFPSVGSGDYAAAVGPNNWSAPGCWYIVRMPGSTIEICVWRDTGGSSAEQANFQIKLSVTGFTDNTNRTASRPPDAADQIVLIGALPITHSSFGDSAASQTVFHMMADDAAVGGVYRFWMGIKNPSTNKPFAGAFLEALTDGPDGDPQPWVIFFRDAADVWDYDELTDDTTGPEGYRDYGGGTELWTPVPFLYYGSIHDGLPVSPRQIPITVDNKNRGLAIPCCNAANIAWKGMTTMLRWKPIATQGYPDRDDPNGAEPRLVWGDLLFPWPTGTVPI